MADIRKRSASTSSEVLVQKFKMKQKIGLWSGVAILTGSIVGSGIFVSPVGVLAGANGSVGVSLLLWVACGLLSGMAALCYAELGTSVSQSGSDFVYLNLAYGEPLGFMFAMTAIFIIRASANAAKAIIFGTYLASPFYPGCSPPNVAVKCASVACLLLASLVNYLSVKAAAKVQIVFTISKFLAMLIIIIGGVTMLAMGNPTGINNFRNAFNSEQLSGLTASQIGLALYQGLFAYKGWDMLNFMAEEVKDVGKNLPRCIIISILSVTLFYVLVNVAYLSVLSPSEMLNSKAVAVTFGDRVLGSFAWIMPLAVCMSVFGSINGSALAGGRLAFATARRGHLPQILSMIHVDHYTPAPALLLEAVLAVIMTIPSDFDTLVNATSFTTWLFYGLCAAAVLVLRKKRPDLKRPYKVPFIIPIIVSIISVYLVIAPLIDNPDLIYLYATIFMLSTLILYFPFVYKNLQIPGIDHVTVFLQQLLNVSPET